MIIRTEGDDKSTGDGKRKQEADSGRVGGSDNAVDASSHFNYTEGEFATLAATWNDEKVGRKGREKIMRWWWMI